MKVTVRQKLLLDKKTVSPLQVIILKGKGIL